MTMGTLFDWWKSWQLSLLPPHGIAVWVPRPAATNGYIKLI